MAWQSAVSKQRPRDFSSNPRSSVGDYLCTNGYYATMLP